MTLKTLFDNTTSNDISKFLLYWDNKIKDYYFISSMDIIDNEVYFGISRYPCKNSVVTLQDIIISCSDKDHSMELCIPRYKDDIIYTKIKCVTPKYIMLTRCN
jgi:hypothetical protein